MTTFWQMKGKCFVLTKTKRCDSLYPLQCSCLENPRDGGAWWAAIYGAAQSRTRLKRLSSSSSDSLSWYGGKVSWEGYFFVLIQCGWAVVLQSASFKATTRVQPLLVQIRSRHRPSAGGGISPFLISPSAAKQNLLSDFQISRGATSPVGSGWATLTSQCVRRRCRPQGC